MKSEAKRVALITAGLLIMTVGLGVFILPSKLASGGLTGLSLVLHHLFPFITVGSMMLIGYCLCLFILPLWLSLSAIL